MNDVLALLDPLGIQVMGDACHVEFHTWFGSREAAVAGAAAVAAYEPSISEQAERNWNESWQSRWEPQAVGRRWYVVPPGHTGPVPDCRIRLEMHAGNSFGNGDHPATHLCLEALEQHCRPGSRFLDFGCGSGLLAIAALELGAAVAAGCDIDEAALGQARRRCPEGLFWRGDITAAAPGGFDLAVANLPAAVIIQVLRDLLAVLSRPGGLICSGLREDQVAPLLAAATGWRAERPRSRDGWFSVVLKVAEASGKTVS